MKQKYFGFTLVEILVVISIISVLAGVLYANFGSARAEARDKVRENTLMEMQIALQLYKSQYGFYPAEGCGSTAIGPSDTPSTPGIDWDGNTTWTGPGPHSASWGNNSHCEEYIVGLAPDFISELPRDPSSEDDDNTGYLYRVDSTGSAYKFLTNASVETDVVDYDHPLSRCPQNFGSTWCGPTAQQNSYAIYSLGAEDW